MDDARSKPLVKASGISSIPDTDKNCLSVWALAAPAPAAMPIPTPTVTNTTPAITFFISPTTIPIVFVVRSSFLGSGSGA
jgi:hypothetical protein